MFLSVSREEALQTTCLGEEVEEVVEEETDERMEEEVELDVEEKVKW